MKYKELTEGYYYELIDGSILQFKSFMRSKPIQFDNNNDCITFRPIPLTEEWARRFNGKFIESLNVFQFQTKQGRVVNLHVVRLEDGKIGLYEDGVRCIKLYVHQPQNLYYALTDEELTLND